MLHDEFLIFSDLHAHNFRYGSKKIPYNDGVFNSRLIDTIEVLDEIMNYAIAHNIKTVLFGGDMFHTRQRYSADVFNLVFEKLLSFSDNGIQLIMIPGNHDYADRDGLVHALQPFEAIENVFVIDREWNFFFTEKQRSVIWGIPYTPSLEEAKERLDNAAKEARDRDVNILLGHLGMQGAKVGSDYVLVDENDVRVSDVSGESFNACFFGHFHEHQQLFSNGWYIGATHEHNWGDSGGKRGFLHVKIDLHQRVSFERIETSAPKFIVMDGEPVPHRAKDFIKVYVDDATPAVIREMQKSIKSEYVTVQPRVDKQQVVLRLEATQLDPESALEAWVKTTGCSESLDLTEVIKLGKKILKEATEKHL